MVDTGAVDRMFDDVEDALLITDADLDEIADFAIYRIQTRTELGRTVKGRYFKAYRPSTRRNRARRGREVKRVTLQDTGKMMASMRGRADEGDALVYFASREEGRKAAWLDEGTSKMDARPFMGMSQKDLDEAAELVLERIEARIAG